MGLEDRIREARKKLKLTQEQAAARIGVAKSTWAGYESGNSQPDIAKLVKIMDVLDVDANYLWQDYQDEKTSPASEDAEEDPISVDEMKLLLRRLGLIGEGDDITEKDVAFVSGIIDLLDAWFNR